jgi:hypothetical protein
MSQPRGRHTGSRDSSQRQPRHLHKASPTPKARSYAKPPSPGPSQTASIFKTRSFQFLVDTVGAENIALGLESSLTRVSELLRGEGFTPETAFHMETTLGLPQGFFDHPHPALAPETITRLRSPLEFVRTDEASERDADLGKPALNVDHQTGFVDSSSEDAKMPKKTAGKALSAAATSGGAKARKPEHASSQQKASPSLRKSSTVIDQQTLPLIDGVALESVRRANLHILTSRKGSKVRLAVVMEMSDSNMSHRLYGKKRLDGVEANRFTERLGLPTGWLDTPRTEDDIPEFVSGLLAPVLRGRSTDDQHESVAATTTNREPIRRPPKNENNAGVLQSADAIAQQSDTAAEEAKGIAPSVQDDASAGTTGASSQAATTDKIDPPASAPTFMALPQRSSPQQDARSAPTTSMTSLENLHGIEPIAEALLKTLAGKARAGRLDELKALELLQQAIRL